MRLKFQVLVKSSEVQPEGRKIPKLMAQSPESEARSRAVVCPRRLSDVETPQHTGRTSRDGCPDQRLPESEVGSLSHWPRGRQETPLVPLAVLQPTIQM